MSGSPTILPADAFHAGQLYRSCFRELTESCGFTPNEMFVLLFLYRNAPEAGHRNCHCTGVERFQAAGDAQRRRTAEARPALLRARRGTTAVWCILHLSDEGHAAAKTLHHRCETFALTLQQGISEQEMQTLCGVMQKMQRNLNDLLERTKLT